MSAANRNLDGKERRSDDYYATPEWCIRAIWPHIKHAIDNDGVIIDPSAGDGAIVRALLALGVPAERIAAVELNLERAQKLRELGITVLVGDTLTYTYAKPCLILMNPPYRQAREHVEHAIKQAAPAGAEVVALLRLGFLGSKRRMKFWEKYPADVYVLPERPSFTGDGKSDASDYAWFVWAPDRGGRWSILNLDEAGVPKRKRRRKNAELFAKDPVPATEQEAPSAEPELAPTPLAQQVLAAFVEPQEPQSQPQPEPSEPTEAASDATSEPEQPSVMPTRWDATPSPLDLAKQNADRWEAEQRERNKQAARAAIAARSGSQAAEEEEPTPEPAPQMDLFGASRVIEAAFPDNDGVELPDFG